MMGKKLKPCEPNGIKFRFTEGIDYGQTGHASIWGPGDKDTLVLLNQTEIRGRWLNLAAGDGRYNLDLLKEADFVVASDIDEGALYKLRRNTPLIYHTKFSTKIFDLTKPFPFEDRCFDGVLCASTLHYFPKDILQRIISEIDRILKPGGKAIIEFATDIRRIQPDGKLFIREKEAQYTFSEGVEVLKKLFKNYQVKIIESKVLPEEVKTARINYMVSAKLILFIGDKIDY
jgi:SAM-dependent methyltransferase